MVLVLAIVAPGQGAQTPGFLAPWLTGPAVDTVTAFSEAAGIDLAYYGTDADAEAIAELVEGVTAEPDRTGVTESVAPSAVMPDTPADSSRAT